MAHILLPIDHSANALNAAVYAVKLFNRPDDRFTVVHAFGLPHGTGGNLVNIDKELAEAAEEDSARFLVELRKQIPETTKLTTRCEHGQLRVVISRMTKELGEPDIIVMGTQGATGLKRVLVGSNTAAVLQNSVVPVLAVPEEAKYEGVARIAVADDGGEVGTDVVKILLDIARATKAEIDILNVVSESTTDKPTAYDALLGALPHSYHQIKGDDVMKALHDSAEERRADILVLLHRERGMFEQFLHRSVAGQLAMYTRIPMLVLHQGR